jgi:hypothetical protein
MQRVEEKLADGDLVRRERLGKEAVEDHCGLFFGGYLVRRAEKTDRSSLVGEELGVLSEEVMVS